MKNLVLLLSFIFLAVGCKKNTSENETERENKRIESINVERQKYNDSIEVLNSKNRFADLEGSHKITYQSDLSNLTGNATFEKTGRDTYQVEGKAQNGANTLQISGEIKRVSETHLNFQGTIKQNIGGGSFERNKKMTFFKEPSLGAFRLQDKVGSEGFVEYIDIH